MENCIAEIIMSRKEELLKYLCKTNDDKLMLESVIDEFLFLEGQLTELKKLPFIQIHPRDPTKQRTTPAAKQYKELLQQYTNILKVLSRGEKDEGESESPLRKWVRKHVDNT